MEQKSKKKNLKLENKVGLLLTTHCSFFHLSFIELHVISHAYLKRHVKRKALRGKGKYQPIRIHFSEATLEKVGFHKLIFLRFKTYIGRKKFVLGKGQLFFQPLTLINCNHPFVHQLDFLFLLERLKLISCYRQQLYIAVAFINHQRGVQ